MTTLAVPRVRRPNRRPAVSRQVHVALAVAFGHTRPGNPSPCCKGETLHPWPGGDTTWCPEDGTRYPVPVS